MKQRFEEIYRTNEWLHGSGVGSLPVHTRGYVRFLQRFLRRQGIKSVVDFGCGDWQFSQFVDWSGVTYTGYDLVESVVLANQTRFATPNRSFHLLDGSAEAMKEADLLLVKDVLQHWSNRAIHAFLPQLARYKYALITNCVHPRQSPNGEIVDGDFRYLDLRLPPFNVPAKQVYAFTNYRPWWRRPFKEPQWYKCVLLVEGGKPIAVPPPPRTR